MGQSRDISAEANGSNTYRHKKTGNLYVLLGYVDVKQNTNDEWEAGVRYQKLEGGTEYATGKDRWLDKFELVEQQRNADQD